MVNIFNYRIFSFKKSVFYYFSLNKDVNQRPKYKQLLVHPFLQKAKEIPQEENAIAYLSDIIDSLELNNDQFNLYYYHPNNSR